MSDAPRTLVGELTAQGCRFAIVASRFNAFVVDRLVEGAVDALVRHGASPGDLTIVRVPGSLEIAIAARRLARSAGFDAIVCLGAVVRGGTPHFEYVAAEAVKSVQSVALETDVPIAMGILTTDTIEQAIERAGTKAGNKGADAAVTAIEMVRLLPKLDGPPPKARGRGAR